LAIKVRIKIKSNKQMKNLARFFKENLGSLCIIAFMALLLASATYLSLGMSREAENLAVIAYFMLVAGVLLQLLSYMAWSRRGGKND